jgi:alkylhydroperoxidase family enzyme
MTAPRAPRIPPLPEDERDEQSKALLDRIRVEGTDLNIFATLIRHPRLFKRWSNFGGFLLYGGELSARDRELLILRTAWNTGADYEWGQHARMARDLGLDDVEISRVVEGADAPGWSPLEAALLVASDELHQDSSISDATWAVLAAHLSEAQLIEVCMVVGQYHLVAFTLNSLGVEREPGVGGFP